MKVGVVSGGGGLLSSLLLLSSTAFADAASLGYQLSSVGSINLKDIETGIPDVVTLFTNQDIAVSLVEMEWEEVEADGNSTTASDVSSPTLMYETFVDGKIQDTGKVDLSEFSTYFLPKEIEVGTISVKDGGKHTIEVIVKFLSNGDDETSTIGEDSYSTSNDYSSYSPGVSIIPLVVIMVLAVTTNMVELSLGLGVFVGACMVHGNINDGFQRTLDDYILNALADVGSQYVFLFTLFLSGIVGMMEKSGGMFGFTRDISVWATTAKYGQLACFSVGIFVFFDDYANVLLAGKTLRPLLDVLSISREKLSFVVDATAAPIASISPVSSWVGFEVGLIQEQLDRIVELEGSLGNIETSGFAVFFQSIKYRYYPIFMIVLMLATILSGRDFGSMLVAERKTRVYKRTDGGDAAEPSGVLADELNAPRQDTPRLSYNMITPVLLLVFFIFYLLVKSGDSGDGTQSIMDKIEASDSYAALLSGTMAAAMLTLIFYWIQPVRDGSLVFPDPSVLLQMCGLTGSASDQDDSAIARPLMPIRDSLESFLHGMGRIFPALIVLTLAWACGTIMTAVGCDRLFSSWIVGGINPESLPTLSFLISLFMALSTGTSWGTMSILFPLIMVPTFRASGGDEKIFYSVVAGVLSGSVAGDHMSPISDTTVLTALACDCKLLPHVYTQAPYVLFTCIVSIILGTIPIGHGAWPNIVGILLGALITILFAVFYCQPVISATGKFDLFTEMVMKFNADSPLHALKEDTIKAHNEEAVVDPNAAPEEGDAEAKKLASDEEAGGKMAAADEQNPSSEEEVEASA